MKRTIPQLFQDSVKKFAKNDFLLEKIKDKYVASSYENIAEQVFKTAQAFYAIGVRKGDRLTLISEGRNDWIITELAMLHIGAINVPLSVKIIEPPEIKFRVKHSGSKIIVTSANQLGKIREFVKEIETIEKIIVLDPLESYHEKEVYLNDLITETEGYFKNQNIEFDQIWQSVEESDCATVSYTSGTTAEPKGIMLSHRNYTANVEQAEGMFQVPSYYRTLLILPWDHSFAHTVGIFPMIKNGASIASIQVGKTANETLKNIPINIKEIQPSFILSVPALAKNFKKNIEKNIKASGATAEKLFKIALNHAYKYHRMGYDSGAKFNWLRKPLLWIFDKILFSKIREGFGGKIQFFVGGGALLDIELQKFFAAVGMPMLQGYGLTEAAPIISSNTVKVKKFGSSGKVVPNLICKILDEDGNEVQKGEKGEIVVKGENVMLGYWNNEEATNECLKDGWLYTGDLGYMSEDGYLYVLGRFKSLLIAEDGEKYSPEGIEEAIVENSKYIEQIMLYNDHKPYTSALIVPNIETLKNAAKNKGLDITSEEGKRKTILMIQEEIQQFYTGSMFETMFPDRWLPSTFALLNEAFTEQNQLMNSTMKIVRGKIMERYQERIDYMYTVEGKKIDNQQNLDSFS